MSLNLVINSKDKRDRRAHTASNRPAQILPSINSVLSGNGILNSMNKTTIAAPGMKFFHYDSSVNRGIPHKFAMHRLPSLNSMLSGQGSPSYHNLLKSAKGMTIYHYNPSDNHGTSHKPIAKEKTVYPRPNLPVCYKTDGIKDVVDVKGKGKEVQPIALYEEFSLNKSNEKINEVEMEEMVNYLRNRFANFRPFRILGSEEDSDVNFDPKKIMKFTDPDAITIIDRKIARAKRNPDFMNFRYQAYDKSSHIGHDWLDIGYQKFHQRDQLQSTDQNCPRASTSAIPYTAQKEAARDIFPMNLGSSGLREAFPNSFNTFNKENVRGHFTSADLIDAIQRVILICHDPQCKCQAPRSKDHVEENSLFLCIEDVKYLPIPSYYGPIPVSIYSDGKYSSMNNSKGSTRFTDKMVFPQSTMFEIFHGPIDGLRFEGLTPAMLPNFISHFNSPKRQAMSSFENWMGVRLYVMGEIGGVRFDFEMKKSGFVWVEYQDGLSIKKK